MFVAVVGLSLLIILWYIWNKIKEVNNKGCYKGYENKPPELDGKLPLIGHAHMFLCNNIEIWNLSKRIAKETLEKGGVITFSLGPKATFYTISDPDDCETISNQSLDKSYVYDFAKNWLGNGILTADVTTWKTHRKLLSPLFNQKTVDSFMGVINKQAKCLVRNMADHVGRGPFEHGRYLATNGLETICITAFGIDPEKHRVLIDNYLEALDEIQNILLERFRKPWLHSDIVYRWTRLKSKETAVIKVLKDLSDTILKERRRAIENNNRVTENFKPFMDSLLELSGEDKVYNDQEIKDEANTIIFGGHDTSSTALIFTLILIGSYPDIQHKVYAEINNIIRNKEDVNRKDLTKLIYLEAVIKETLRLYPIGALVARQTDEDVKLKNYTIPAGSSCFLNFWGIHHHPIWGPDAEQFRPERWLDSTLPRNPNAFVAFHIGKRSCIGRLYAMITMKTTLAHLLRHYRIKADVTKLVVKLDMFLKPASGHYITIEKRI